MKENEKRCKNEGMCAKNMKFKSDGYDKDYSILIQAFYVFLYVHRIRTRACATVTMNEHTRCCVIATYDININSSGDDGDRIAFV